MHNSQIFLLMFHFFFSDVEPVFFLCYNYIMISIRINDINNFMQNLLSGNIFDSFLCCDGEISTATTYSFHGRINKDFYTSDELETLTEDFIPWKNIKHICYEIIKGKKPPTKIKLVLSLPKASYSKMISDTGVPFTPENIGGLYLHLLYEKNEMTIITGTSLNIFTMDKTLDQYWDNQIKIFLDNHFNTQEI